MEVIYTSCYIIIINMIKNHSKINLKKANDIKQIMQVEGETWQRLYGEFKNILPEEFVMNNKVYDEEILGNPYSCTGEDLIL
ncbi:hypothetical protein K144316041_13760 [Clostridium tetani]|nr:hypothetical protein K144316041_13760 [Clostridium tetani]CDI49624.1 CRISPR-associated Cas1 family protein [Clostridium tetani 12124569]